MAERRRRSRAPLGRGTLAVHASNAPDLNAGAVVAPIYQTSTYRFPAAFSEAREHGRVHLYTRIDNPSVTQAGEAVRALEGGGAGRVYASGMAALSLAILGHLRAGDEVVAPEALYGNTWTLLRDFLPRWGIAPKWVRTGEPVEDQLTTRTRLVLVETPNNPTLRVLDIRRWADAAHRVGAPLLVDSTFASPVNQNPLEHGADLVMHSATKYLGGHSDLIAGALVSRDPKALEQLDTLAITLGGCLDPFAAFLLSRGIKTLPLRVARQNETARALREELGRHPKIEKVLYPGSAGPDEERICRRQMRGRGGMVSFVVRGGLPGARRWLRGLRLVHVASSLGGVESLVSLPVETSHRQLAREERERRGIADGLARFSFGTEDAADLLADLRTALKGV